jgi:hypothetical protein
MGVRALDHLAGNFQPPPPPAEGAEAPAAAPNAVRTLIDQWKSMTTDEKEEFVERVASSVVEVVAASAALPLGLKLGKQAAKATKKVIRRESKKMRKAAKSSAAAEMPKKGKSGKKKKG